MGGHLRIECLAHYDEYLFDKKELALVREEPQHSRCFEIEMFAFPT